MDEKKVSKEDKKPYIEIKEDASIIRNVNLTQRPEGKISKESETEAMLWEVLEKIQFIPTYHARSKEEILFELGKIYSQTYDWIQNYRKRLMKMEETREEIKEDMKSTLKMEREKNDSAD